MSNLSLIVEWADIIAKNHWRKGDRCIGLICQENPQGVTEGVTNKQAKINKAVASQTLNVWGFESGRWKLPGLWTVHLCVVVPRAVSLRWIVIVNLSVYHDCFSFLGLAAVSWAVRTFSKFTRLAGSMMREIHPPGLVIILLLATADIRCVFLCTGNHARYFALGLLLCISPHSMR